MTSVPSDVQLLVEAGVSKIIRKSGWPMISIDSALEIILREMVPPAEEDFVSLPQALSRILAKPVYATSPLPPFPASIMDGYAVIAKDGCGPRKLIGDVRAGGESHFRVESGTVSRITTGAPVPEGADAVVMVERTELCREGDKEWVNILQEVSPGTNIRPIGSDITSGDLILSAGSRIGAAEIGLLATVGLVKQIPVQHCPVVGVLSTGDELVDPESEEPGNKIRDSNRSMLLAVIRETVGQAVQLIDLGIVKDTTDLIEAKITEALNTVDVLITSGGVSMGESDLIKPLLGRLGTIHFGRVSMKPGKPLTFATVSVAESTKRRFVFGLPGNPVSSLVTFYLTVLPGLKALSGHPHPKNVRITTKILNELKLDPERPEYHRASIWWDSLSNGFVAKSTGNQISSRLLSMRTANALLLLPQQKGSLPVGSLVDALLIGAPYPGPV